MGAQEAMKRPKLIVFDMDGVIIDVSRSYRETVRQTARLFLQGAKNFEKLPDPLFPLVDLARLKQTGGLNNDWDLTAQVLSLLFALVKALIDPAVSATRLRHEETIKICDVSALADFLKTSSSPLMDLFIRYGRRKDPFIAECFKGEVCTGNIIKRLFQEIYLGGILFLKIYGFGSRFWKRDGLINKEGLLIDRTILKRLAERHFLAIATGRPRMEADYALDHFTIREYFQMVITLDDCTLEEERIFKERGDRVSLGKPNPFMLDLIPRHSGPVFLQYYYLGDTPDDMLAARSSQTGYQGVGVVLASPDQTGLRKELLKAGAHHIIDDYSNLPNMMSA
jgi:phosphoglycolate phosphatase-like HAD superfamily hydrolase